MFDPNSPVPGAQVVRAWSTVDGVVVSWPGSAPRPAALSAAVEQFCQGLAEPAAADPDPSVQLRYLELQVTDSLATMIVHAFALTPELVEDIPGQPVGPGHPWAEFRQALIGEAVRRRTG